jgi:Tol biopolymer transport system component
MHAKMFQMPIRIFFALYFIFSTTTSPGLSQALQPDMDRRRPGLQGGSEYHFDAPPLNPINRQVQERVPAGINAPRLPWSKVVFESYRDNNYEIYIANDDGSGLARLTNNPASDIHPRLNRGGSRIAFASYRTGNWDIFSMNPDGSSLLQLTNNAKDDVNPAWSPDGTQIAFQSYRDGQSEIYVMNPNGGNQKRLTVDSGYDGEPTWSPDGSKIAWCAFRSGEYHIWVMNTDGSGQIQLSLQRYSENPAWSPDGSQIAFDSDGNNDGWQEVWLMNADGSNQHIVYTPTGVYQDALMRDWSPDGSWMAYTHVYYTYYNGNWYWTDALMKMVTPTPVPATELDLFGTNLDWLPDWQTLDPIVPTSSMGALPAISPGPFMVSWSGNDTGGSGFKSFDVQV